jgi:hypothetical protein
MKGLPLIFLFALIFGTVSAQDVRTPIKKNTIFLELGGNSPFYSLNYDRIVLEKPKLKLAARIGAMYVDNTNNFLSSIKNHNYSLPLELSFLKGRNNHNLEIGIGATPYFREYVEETRNDEFFIAPFGRIGYRYQKENGGVFFKAGFTPIIRFKKDWESYNPKYVYPWGGLAIGYTLKN